MDFIINQVKGMHLHTLNKSKSTRHIYDALSIQPPTRCNNNCAAENRESGSIKRQEVGEKELKGSL